MDHWKKMKAADLIEFNPREQLAKGQRAKKIAMERLQPFAKDIQGYEIALFNGGSKFRNGDTLMARITPCLENGKTAQVNILDEDEIGFGSTEFIVLRAKPGISDKDYIFYLATSPLLRDIAIQSMVGSSGRQRVQQDVLSSIEFLVPPYPEQVEIGRTLRALDDKIYINTKINNHLAFLSETDNSPDISFGRRTLRTSMRCMLSSWLALICENSGSILALKIAISCAGGMKTGRAFRFA